MATGKNSSSDIISEAARRQEELIAELNQSAIVEVLGVVHASGAAGSKAGGELWTLSFTFEVWKYSSGEIQNRPLAIRKPVGKEDLRLAMSRIKSYDVIRVRARVAEINSSGAPKGLLVEIIGRDNSDEELGRWALKLQEPVTFADERFGVFTLDRRVDWYETSATWNSNAVRLVISSVEREEINGVLANAYSLWDSKESWDKRISEYAAAKLLDLKNAAWLDEEEKELDALQFVNRIKLESICLRPGGGFEFWYNDGGLFAGHAIMVSGNFSDGPTNTGIEG